MARFNLRARSVTDSPWASRAAEYRITPSTAQMAAAVSAVFDIYREQHLVEHVREVGAYLTEKLEELAQANPLIKERRGIHLIQGLEFTIPVAPLIRKCLEHGLILISAGANVVRFLPPLIARREHVDAMLEILEKSIRE